MYNQDNSQGSGLQAINPARHDEIRVTEEVEEEEVESVQRESVVGKGGTLSALSNAARNFSVFLPATRDTKAPPLINNAFLPCHSGAVYHAKRSLIYH